MLPELRAGAEWLVHPNLYEQLEYITFKDQTSSQVPIFLPANGMVSAPFGTLKGRPVRPFEFCSDLGQLGDILFVNWGMYITLLKAGKSRIQTASSMHVRFLYDEMAYKSNFRIDCMSMLPAPIEDFNGTTKRSAFVTLTARRSEGTSSGL
jgi:HK97 family phage major capsid protein